MARLKVSELAYLGLLHPSDFNTACLIPTCLEVGTGSLGLLWVWLTLGLFHGCGAGKDVDHVEVV